MSAPGNRTVDRIQQEIQESIEREKELRNKYNNQLNNNNSDVESDGETETVEMNGYVNKTIIQPPPVVTPAPTKSFANVAFEAIRRNPPQQQQQKNGISSSHRLFTQNTSTRGVMQKFYQMRGKINAVALKQPNNNQQRNHWTQGEVAPPPKVTIEPGKDLRNGFVSAKQKMERELQEFRQREEELRNERRKSQPNLMAALELEDEIMQKNHNNVNNGTQRTYSVSSLNNEEEWDSSSHSSTSISNNINNNNLKRSQSLAALCDFGDDEEIDAPGTHSLIMQFESLNRSQS